MATQKVPLDDPGRVPNPYQAYAWVWIEQGKTPEGKTNWVEITMEEGRPQRLVQFEYHRIANGGNTVSITLYDKKWEFIESLVISAESVRMRWKYGYTNGGQLSPLYEGVISGYTPNFRIDGVEIQIEAYSVPFLSGDGDFKQRSKTYVDAKGNPLSISEIVADIAQENDWDTSIETTAPYYGDTDLEKSKKVPYTFVQNKERDFDFLLKLRAKAEPLSITSRSGPYMLAFEDRVGKDGKLKNLIHFHPPKFDGKVVKAFTFMRDRQSEIISFKPDINGMSLLRLGAGSVTSFWINHQTGEVGSVKMDNSTTPTKQILGGKITDVVPHDDKESANLIANTHPIRDAKQASTAAWNNFIRAYWGCLSASLVILGDPQFMPQHVIWVSVPLPNGSLHYTSGYWLVYDLTDVIAGGSFTTQMTLKRNAYLGTKAMEKAGLGAYTAKAVGTPAQAGKQIADAFSNFTFGG